MIVIQGVVVTENNLMVVKRWFSINGGCTSNFLSTDKATLITSASSP